MILLLFLLFLVSVWISGFIAGVIVTLRKTTKHLKEQNDVLALQNKTLAEQSRQIAEYKARDDGSDWWKPAGWGQEDT